MPIDLRKALNTNDPKWDKLKQGYKKVETGAWKALEPVGRWTNRTAGKLGAESFWPTELGLECDKAARILRTFTNSGAGVEVDANNAAALNDQSAVVPPSQQVDAQGRKVKDPHKYDHLKTQKVIRKIPPKVLRKAHGLAIFTVFRTGFGFSGAGGSGVVLSRLPDGSWSPPSGILLHTIGWGLLVGADIYDVVLVLRNQKAVDAFKHPKISIGGELSAATGPVGNGVMLDSGVEAAPCWSYVKSKGLYIGMQLDGNIILKRDDANARFYNAPGITTGQVLSGQLPAPAPAAVMPLWQTIYAAEGRPQLMGTDKIPTGNTPGDLELTDQDMHDASAYAEQEMNHAGPTTVSPTATSAGAGAGLVAGTNISSAHNVAPASAIGVSTTAQHPTGASQPYSDLPPDYDFANSPVNAQGGKTIRDAPSAHPNQPAAGVLGGDQPPSVYETSASNANPTQYETAEQEKERLRQQYGSHTSSAGSSSATATTLPSRVKAVYDFDPQEAEDLAFKVGDIIEVIGKEDDMWWRGQIGGRTGIFPSNYTQAI